MNDTKYITILETKTPVNFAAITALRQVADLDVVHLNESNFNALRAKLPQATVTFTNSEGEKIFNSLKTFEVKKLSPWTLATI